MPVPLSIPLAAGVAAVIAWILSFPLFRLKAFSFLIGSFAAGEAIRLCWRYFDTPSGPGHQPDPGVSGHRADQLFQCRQLLLSVSGGRRAVTGHPLPDREVPDRTDIPLD
ncbi:MAG: hypothetical protein U5K73_09680 [Halofilum sp. (in: g-proteobacteria)]|nr:hypothetical protein [Halofilum sp. (in: g-proteobacteria)]